MPKTPKVIRSKNNGSKVLIYHGVGIVESNSEDESQDKDTIPDSTAAEIVTSEDVSVLLVGDIIWSKVTGHSWWPSMIAYEPNAGIYFQASSKHPTIPLKYHVQFFGEKPLRGWVAKSNILKFQGREDYLNLIPHCSTSNQTKSWDHAVTEAEEAFLLDRNERKLAWVFNYGGSSSEKIKKRRKPKSIVPKPKKVTTPGERQSSRLISRRSGKPPSTKSICSSTVNLTIENILPDEPRPVTQERSSHETSSKSTTPLKESSCETSSSIVSDEEKTSTIPSPGTVLKDISWEENELLNRIQYRDGENSSDSGIEDVETLEYSSDDMELLGEKRKRKPKVFDGFHTGNEIEIAFKKKSKLKVEAAEKGVEDDCSADKGSVPSAVKGEKENVLQTDTTKPTKEVVVKKGNSKQKSVNGSNANEEEAVKGTVETSSVKPGATETSSVKPTKGVGAKKANSKKKSANNSDLDKGETKLINSDEAGVTKPTRKRSSSFCEVSTSPVLKPVKRKISESSPCSPHIQEEVKPAKKGKKELGNVTNGDMTSKKIDFTKIIDSSAAKKPCKVSSADESDWTIPVQVAEYKPLDNKAKVCGPSSKSKCEQKDNFCAICEGVSDSNLICCSGTCLNQFHPNCLGLNFQPEGNFYCDECTSGFHTCFACKKAGQLTKCSQSCCGKYYHLQCVQKHAGHKFENKLKEKFVCPLHVCKFCSKAACNVYNRRKLKCIRCPTSYHYSCLTAGCQTITSSHMICDDHYVHEPNAVTTNANWCFVCSLGGSLVCCETCPASFHPECSEDLTGVPEGAWRCRDCRDGVKNRYGDIVWVKFSVYRWWPGKICHPEDIPEKIRNLPHSIGEFPVLFFGSEDYSWLNSRRVFKYADGDKGARERNKKYLKKYFAKALEEAKEAFDELEKMRMEKKEANNKKVSNKPPPYRVIKRNLPVTCIQTVLDESEWPICECEPHDPCGTECLNKMLFYECNPLKCRNGDKCRNQRMQKCEYAKVVPFKSESKGWGLLASQALKAGDFVIEYVGELIDEQTCRQRIKQYYEKDVSDFYFLTIDKDNIIDAYPKGNLSRFMNHSCGPNCETQKWTVNGVVRVGLFANCDIAVGEELSFNYNLDCLGNEKKQCKCGSTNCSGLLGVQPKTQHSITDAEKSKKTVEKRKLKRRRSKLLKIRHEDDCYLCGDGGELILCGRLKCPKSYHVECLMIKEPPKRKWDCPWHYCDDCGKPAKSMCSLCPNSFCHEHIEGQMTELEPDVITCPSHTKAELEKLKSQLKEAKKEALAAKNKEKNNKAVAAKKSKQTINHSNQIVNHSKQTVNHSKQTVNRTNQTVGDSKLTINDSKPPDKKRKTKDSSNPENTPSTKRKGRIPAKKSKKAPTTEVLKNGVGSSVKKKSPKTLKKAAVKKPATKKGTKKGVQIKKKGAVGKTNVTKHS